MIIVASVLKQFICAAADEEGTVHLPRNSSGQPDFQPDEEYSAYLSDRGAPARFCSDFRARAARLRREIITLKILTDISGPQRAARFCDFVSLTQSPSAGDPGL